MGRILAIDYGTKRTGIAVTDPLRIVPGGLKTVATHELNAFLADYFSKESVDVIVVGHPTNMNGERFTSVIAQRAILDSGIGRMARRNKALVDEVSATIILESFMDSKQYKEI